MKLDKVISRLLIFLYLSIPYFPLFGEIDRIASQWAILSIVSFLSLIFLYFNSDLDKLFKIIETKPIIFFGIFLLFSVLSITQSVNITESLVEFFRYFSVFLLIIILPTLVSKNNYKFLILLSIIFSCVDIIGILTQNNFGLPLIGFTGNKNIASASLIMKSNFLLYIIYRYDNVFSNILAIILLCTSYIVVLLIGSKAGLLSIFLIFIILLITIIIKREIFKKNLIAIIPMILSIFLFTIGTETVETNVFDGINQSSLSQEDGITDRLRYYSQATESFFESPLLGIGLGNWKINSIKYDSSFMNNYIVQYHSHNDYIQLLAETGIGAVFYLLFILSIVFKIFKQYKNLDNQTINYKSIWLIAVLCFLIYFIDSNLNFPAARVVMQLNLASLIALVTSLSLNGEIK